MQPGQTITPGSPPEQPTQEPATPPAPEAPTTPEPQPQQSQESVPEFSQESVSASPGQVTWTASEYIAHAKGAGWFILLGLGLFALVALVYLVTKDIVASVLVGLAGITFGIFAARPPRVLTYVVDSRGISIGQRFHAFGEFKSFALTETGPFPSILLMPLKRFMPPITVFYDPKEEDAIVDTLANYLPHENKEPDFVDRLMGRIRF